MKENKSILLIITIYLLLRVIYFGSPATIEEINFSNLGLSVLFSRILSIVLGLFSIFIFVKLLSEFKVRNIFLTTFLFIVSPWLIQINVFSLTETLAILLFLVVLTKFRIAKKLVLLSPLVIIVVLSISNLSGLFEQTIFHNLLPGDFLWQIDRRLAISKVEGYSGNIQGFDLSRLVHNKPFYSVNNFFISLITPFSLEEISSPIQAYSPTQLEVNNSIKLPKIFFFELPLILLGIVTAFRDKNRILKLSGILMLWSLIFYKSVLAFVFLVPFLIIFEGIGLARLVKIKPKIILPPLLIIFLFGQLSFWDILKNHPSSWMGNEDFAQYKISQAISQDIKGYQKINITDRLGDPKKYFSYYYRGELAGKNITYGSFKYLETDRRDGDIWIGLPGEFVASNFNQDKDIDNGIILKKIKDVKQPDKNLGEEVWIVQTKVN